MYGLHIKPNWQPAIPAEQRSFATFFWPIFPQLTPFHWIYPDTIPILHEDEDFKMLVETTCSAGYIPPDTLLPRFARFVGEDCTELYGFRMYPDVPAIRGHLQKSPTDYEWLSMVADICFFNVDGAWWEIYTKEHGLLETIRRHVIALPNIAVQDRILARRDIYV